MWQNWIFVSADYQYPTRPFLFGQPHCPFLEASQPAAMAATIISIKDILRILVIETDLPK